MKKIVFIVLFLLSNLVKGQLVYGDKKEYDNAIKNYNDALESHINYIKKINFYKNYRYPKNKPYPNSWYEYFKPLLVTNDIKMDNYKVRYHKNVKPDGTIYVNFNIDPNSDFLSVTLSDVPSPNYLYSASIYKFNHPGKSPVFKEKETLTDNNTTYSPSQNDTIVIEPKIIFVPSVEVENLPTRTEFYIMPNGSKYTYEQLVRHYPSMADNRVFYSNFKD